MARTDAVGDAPAGATMFLVDTDNPGFRLGRRIHALDSTIAGGHPHVHFDGCVVPADAVLGAVGEGFRNAQVRLGPARLTHCMRWLGLARRSLDIALDRVQHRELFGSRLSDLGLAQELIASSVIDLETSGRRHHPHRAAAGVRSEGRFCAVVGGQGVLLRGDLSGHRPRHAAVRRRRDDRRPSVGLVPERGAAVPGLRRLHGDPEVGHRPACRRRPAGRGGRRGTGPGRPDRGRPGRAVTAGIDGTDGRDVVRTRAEAAELDRPPLLVLDALTGFLDDNGVGSGDLEVRRIGEGQSNVTFAVQRGDTRVVVRRGPRPPLPRSTHDMVREARVQQFVADPRHPGAGRCLPCAPTRRCSGCRST